MIWTDLDQSRFNLSLYLCTCRR